MKITITGPGLVVNGPALVVLKALRDIGYKIQCEDWAGKAQWSESEEDNLRFVKMSASDCTIEVEVDPQPWGS